MSRYRILFVKMSWYRTVDSLMEPKLVGMVLFSFSMSSTFRVGTHLSASGSSGVSCFSCNFFFIEITFSISSGVIALLIAARRAASSFSILAPSSGSGFTSTVTRWALSRRYFLIRLAKTSSPDSRRALRVASGFSNFRGSIGSRSCSQVCRAPSMIAIPLGKPPVFSSRMANSVEFMEASICSLVKPSSATFLRVDMISSSSLAQSSSFTFFIPTLYVYCRRLVSRPPPITEAPKPDSFRARRRGAALLPMIMSFISPRARSSTGSISAQLRSQLILRYVLADKSSSLLAAKYSVSRRGSV
mmetsp:Transcript_128063/g.221273  ORF Transcript_128063/g.221273 Transcript_128063/m.221273 type:complete len:302 (+) Transcript_128063:1670-2575(+)